MNIAFLVERPTQFEAPFFRFANRDPEHELHVLFTRPEPSAAVFDAELGQEVSWGIDLLGGYPSTVLQANGQAGAIRRHILEHGCDLFIVNGYTQLPYLRGALAARRAGAPLALRIDSVTFPRDPPPSTIKRLVFAVLKRVYSRFLAVGTLTIDYLVGLGVSRERIGLFPYAVDVDAFRSCSRLESERRERLQGELGIPAGARAILAVAKLNERETPADLFAALPALPADHVLVLAGDGPRRTELEQRCAVSAPGRVRFLGYHPYPELPALYGASDLFVHAPAEERWGVSVAEAMASGLPVVTSDRVGAGVDLIEPGRNGSRYPAGDPQALAAAIEASLALDRRQVAHANEEILARWDYAATWQAILGAARSIRPPAPPGRPLSR
ncbi:MAG TPA: glycosyltransferase family 4 protein [Thermoanaerobaculia bacterium]|nr:glycosyltransferase family 4 protein [Thermoanaerobaculia bacterium]